MHGQLAHQQMLEYSSNWAMIQDGMHTMLEASEAYLISELQTETWRCDDELQCCVMGIFSRRAWLEQTVDSL